LQSSKQRLRLLKKVLLSVLQQMNLQAVRKKALQQSLLLQVQTKNVVAVTLT